jgi:pyridoxamine 5'-phosphate oxidase
VPRPEWWGGYWLVADAVELWRSGVDRMHDRVRHVREGATWTGERLAP